MEVPAGGSPPAVGGEGGRPCLLPMLFGGALIYVTTGDQTLGLVSGAAGAASSFLEGPQVWGAGGAAAAAEAEGGCLPLPSGPEGARYHVTNECESPEYVLGAVAAAFLFITSPRDRRAGEAAAVEMPAVAAVERAGARARRDGGRRAGRRARRQASWARVVEVARAAGACAGEGWAGGGAESGSRVCPVWGRGGAGRSGSGRVGVGRGCSAPPPPPSRTMAASLAPLVPFTTATRRERELDLPSLPVGADRSWCK